MPNELPTYEIQPRSPRWGIFERGADEPALANIGSRQAAEDLARAMNWAAADRQRYKSFSADES